MSKPIMHIHLNRVTSTNTWAKENYDHFDLNQVTRITASMQTNGRGRFNRRWISPKDVNLYVTYFFTTKKNRLNLSNLSQFFCLSITKLLHYQNLSPQIKWPNDLLVKEKKISGVLCETIDLKERDGVILGAGVNINMTREDLNTIDQPATSILNETGKLSPLNPLLNLLDQFFIDDLSLYQSEGFTPFYMAYESLLAHKGKPILLYQNDHQLRGTLDSLNPDGRLNILLDSGEIKTVSSGEIKK